MQLTMLSLMYKGLYTLMVWQTINRASRAGRSGPGFSPNTKADEKNWWVKNGGRINGALGIMVLANACINIVGDRAMDIRQMFAFIIFLTGDGLVDLAETTLGKFFTPRLGTYDDHKLITTGPYQHLRHPGYCGFFICFFSMSLYVFDTQRHWYDIYNLGVMLMPLLSGIFFFVCRVPEEEAMLEKKFGREWLLYRESIGCSLNPP